MLTGLITDNIEIASKQINYAVDVAFQKDGQTYQANVTCILNEDSNIGFKDWDCIIANEEDLPDLTTDEENQILDHAKKYAQYLDSTN